MPSRELLSNLRRTWRDHRYLVAVAAIVVFVALPTVLYPYGCDQAAFSYVALVWNRGGLPYRDAWDIKPPGIYALYAIAQWIDPNRMRSYHWLDIPCTTAAALLLAETASRAAGRWAGIFAGLLFGSITYLCFGLSDIGQCESFAALPFAIILEIVSRRNVGWRQWLVVGTMTGLMALLKTPLVLLAACALPCLLRSRTDWKPNVAAGMVGLLAPILATVAYFAAHGALRYLVELLRMQAQYNSGGFTGASPKWMLLQLADEKRTFIWLVALAVLGWLASRRLRRRLVARTAMLALLLAAVIICIQGRYYSYHWLAMLPATCLLVGVFLGQWVRAIQRRFPQLTIASLAVTILAFAVPLLCAVRPIGLALSLLGGKISLERYYGIESTPNDGATPIHFALAKAVTEACPPGGTVMAINLFQPRLMAITGLPCPCRRFIGAYTGYSPLLRKLCIEESARVFRVSPPSVVVCAGPPYQPGLYTEAMLEYTEVQVRKRQPSYRRKPGATPARESFVGAYEWPTKIEPWGVPYVWVKSVDNFRIFRLARR